LKKQTTNGGEDAGKKDLIHCWKDCKLVGSLWKSVWRFLKKLNVDLPYDPTLPLLYIYLKEYKTICK
jgi:hypothetical protein